MTLRFLFISLSLILSIFMSGCAERRAESPDDPMEPLNRRIHGFNRALDGLYIRPVSKAYDTVLPLPVTSSISNAMNNLGEVPTVANQVLQGKLGRAANDTGRFLLNSTLGIFGIFDVATPIGLERHKEDFGQTLSKWGWQKSSYFVIPVLGPSTVRDTLGIVVNTFMTVPYYFEPKWRNRYYGMQLIVKRTELKDFEGIVGAAGVDEYALIRTGYLQNRNYQIQDGVSSDSTGDGEIDFLGEPPE